MDDLDKKYYKIKDVAQMIGVPQSTLRYWEREFPSCSPTRSSHNQRYYTPRDVEQLRVIHYLLKVKGLKMDAAKEQLRANPANLSRNMLVIQRLQQVRDNLSLLSKALGKRLQDERYPAAGNQTDNNTQE